MVYVNKNQRMPGNIKIKLPISIFSDCAETDPELAVKLTGSSSIHGSRSPDTK
jgi:hypothetical protein